LVFSHYPKNRDRDCSTYICLAACCGILAGLGRGEERPLHQRCRRSLWFAGNGRSCCSTVGSLSRPTLFVKTPSFVRSSVHPSVYTKIAQFASELQYLSPVSQPRTASVYCCHLLNVAFCLRSQGHSTRSSTRPTGHGHRHCHRGCHVRRSQIERRAPQLARCQPSSRGTSN
jgi:hypothetical protein